MFPSHFTTGPSSEPGGSGSSEVPFAPFSAFPFSGDFGVRILGVAFPRFPFGAPMRENLTLAVAAFLFVALVTSVGVIINSYSAPKPPEVNCRILDCDPDFFAGREVRVRTDGMEPGAGPNELVYRKVSEKPPAVVCRFKGNSPPSPLPALITGTCLGRRDGAVVVADCR